MSANLRDFTLIDHQNNLSSLGTDHVNKTKNEAFHDDKKVHQSVGQNLCSLVKTQLFTKPRLAFRKRERRCLQFEAV
ncbi:MAG: hypothetical protein ACRCYZ_01100, partial [Alphaproteobacteria bacterium]